MTAPAGSGALLTGRRPRATLADASAFAERAVSAGRAMRLLNALTDRELADLRNLVAECGGIPTDATLRSVAA